jgi:hypothetical protein
LGLVGGIFLFIGGIYWAMQVFAAETALYGIYGYRVGAFGMDPTPFYVSYAFTIAWGILAVISTLLDAKGMKIGKILLLIVGIVAVVGLYIPIAPKTIKYSDGFSQNFGIISLSTSFILVDPFLILVGGIFNLNLIEGPWPGLVKKLADKRKMMKRYGVIAIMAVVISPVAYMGGLIVYWYVRPPPSFETDPILQLQTWTAIPPGDDMKKQHQSNTDLTFYNGKFYLCYQSSKWHLQDHNGELIVATSTDGKFWKKVISFRMPDNNTDVRDPQFLAIHGKLFLYFLPNYNFDPGPNMTYYSVSSDGMHWQAPKELFVKVKYEYPNGTITYKMVTSKPRDPKTYDGITWYAMGGKRGVKYPGKASGYTILLKSTDGLNWEEVSEVYPYHSNGEPCFAFLPDGGIIGCLRCGSLGSPGYEFGNPTGCTIIVTSHDYIHWSFNYSFITRLDGGLMFSYKGRIFATGRNQEGPTPDCGSHVTAKRTAVYEVKKDRLIFLFNLPSNGDTAYCGVQILGNTIYISYYTPPIDKNYPWILGICFLPRTEIRMAKFSADGLIQYADQIGGV